MKRGEQKSLAEWQSVAFRNQFDAAVVYRWDLSQKTMELLAYSLAFESWVFGNQSQMSTAIESLLSEKGLEMSVLQSAGLHEQISLDGDEYEVRVLELNRVASPCFLATFRKTSDRSLVEKRFIEQYLQLKQAHEDLAKAHSQVQRSQAALVESGRLASLGTMAAGLAHELNQPLTAIRGFTQESLAQLGRPDIVASFLKEVIHASDRMQTLIQQMRQMARGQVSVEREPIMITESIQGVLQLMRRTLSQAGVQVHLEGLTMDLPVLGQKSKLEQVLINLFANAIDAMNEKDLKQRQLIVRVARLQNGGLKLDIADTGSGMDEKTKQRIFEPFFTTKEVGKGTGLGLTLVHGILSDLGYSIEVQSQLGAGTQFSILIPSELVCKGVENDKQRKAS